MTEKDTKNTATGFAANMQSMMRPGKNLTLALFGASALFFGKVEAQQASAAPVVTVKQQIGDAKDAEKGKNFAELLHYDFIDYNQEQKLVSAYYDVGSDAGIDMRIIKHFKKTRKPVDVNKDKPESSTFVVRDGQNKIVLNRKTDAAEFDISVNNAADVRFKYDKADNVDATIGALIDKPRDVLHKLIEEVKNNPHEPSVKSQAKMTL